MSDKRNDTNETAAILVIGVGGSGQHTINQLAEGFRREAGTKLICADTDPQRLKTCKADICLQLADGAEADTRQAAGAEADARQAAGAEADTQLAAGAEADARQADGAEADARQAAGVEADAQLADGAQAAGESREKLAALVKGADMVFVTCGMDDAAGAGAAPVVAGIARESGSLTVGIVTKPASFQTGAQREQAIRSMERLKEAADTLLVIPADDPQKAEDTLRQGVCCMTDLVNVPANVMDLDFADLRDAMQGRGIAHIGVGTGSGEEKCLHAVRQALQSAPLEAAIPNASHVILDMAGDATLADVMAAADFVEKLAGETTTMLPRFLYDNSRPDAVTVTVIATGLGTALEA